MAMGLAIWFGSRWVSCLSWRRRGTKLLRKRIRGRSQWEEKNEAETDEDDTIMVDWEGRVWGLERLRTRVQEVESRMGASVENDWFEAALRDEGDDSGRRKQSAGGGLVILVVRKGMEKNLEHARTGTGAVGTSACALQCDDCSSLTAEVRLLHSDFSLRSLSVNWRLRFSPESYRNKPPFRISCAPVVPLSVTVPLQNSDAQLLQCLHPTEWVDS